MAIIPDVNLDDLRLDLKDKIDSDKKAPCIWCKTGGGKGKGKHMLLDCPNARLVKGQRTKFCDDVEFGEQTDIVIAYIHQVQQRHWRRADGRTPFSSERTKNNLMAVPDEPPTPKAAATTTAQPVPVGSAAAATPSAPTLTLPVMTRPAQVMAAVTPATVAMPTITAITAPRTAPAPRVPTATTTAPPHRAPTATAVPPTASSSTNTASNSVSTGTPIPMIYEDEDVQLLPRQLPPNGRMMQRGGLVVKPIEDTDAKLAALKNTALDFPPRTEFASAKDMVYTNHFNIPIKQGLELYKYTIEHDLPGKNKRKFRALIKTAIASYGFLAANEASLATDHYATVIAWKPLHSVVGTQHELISGNGDTPTSTWQLRPYLQDDQNEVRVTFVYHGVVDIDSLLRYTEIDPTCAQVDLEPTKRALNIIISKCFGETTADMIQVGANKFFHKGGINELRSNGQVSDSLCTMRGYYYTVKAGVRNVLLNINPCTSAFFTRIKVSKLMRDGLTFKTCELEGVLRGLRVRIELKRGDNKSDPNTFARLNTPQARVKTILGLGRRLDQETFTDDKGNHFNVYTHLTNTYPHRTIDPSLLAVNLGSSYEPKWYSPEDLMIMPYQRYTSMVPTALTDSMLQVACLEPNDAAARVDIEALNALGISSTQIETDPLAKCSALSLNPQMLLVPSRHLDYPKIQYKNGTVSGEGSWNFMRLKFFSTQKKAFNILVLLERGINRNIGLQNFRRFADANYGIMNVNLQSVQHQVLNNPTDAAEIKTAIQNRSPKPHLVLLILKSRSVEAYSRFKSIVDTSIGCHSICMTDRIFSRGDGKSMGNVMMKANLKGAGSNHTIQGGELQRIMANTLVLGADVTHPSGGSILGCPSIAAIVGSVDDHAGRFLGSMRLQSTGKKEIIDSVESMVVERIKDWVKNNDLRLPENIIYYRDGVSEGQYISVRDDELPQILTAFPKALEELRKELPSRTFSGKTPKLTAIVCAKRHHVRFYPLDEKLRNGNCLPGTYVDDVVTSPYYVDFYLQSHAPLHGTARPAHYFVLRKDTDTSIEQLRQFTHELCFTYVRTTSAVSYASPAYYADRLCERGRCYLRDFFINTPTGKDHRGALKKFKHDKEKNLATERTTKFGALWKPDHTRRGKNQKEQEMEDDHRKQVIDGCSQETMRLAKKVFYTNGPDKNPWKDSIAHTMFWM